MSAWQGAGAAVVLFRDGQYHLPTDQRPYLGETVVINDHLAQVHQVFRLPAGILPTADVLRAACHVPTAFMTGRAQLRPGCCYSQARLVEPVRRAGWLANAAGPASGNWPALHEPDLVAEASCGLVDPFAMQPWLPIAGPQRLNLRAHMWEAGRAALALKRQGRWLAALGLLAKQLPQVFSARREDTARLAPVPLDGRFSVTYVLDRLVIAGGVLSVIQLVNELILLGVDARIACLFEDPAIFRWQPLLTRPLVYRNDTELVKRLPPTDLAVATLWKTAPWVAALEQSGRATGIAYFLQDYEPWFFAPKQKNLRTQVTDSYAITDRKIVKSDWLADKLLADGHTTHKIPLGINLDLFRPDDQRTDQRATIMAMARPGTAQRGFDRLAETLTLLGQSKPDIDVILFGSSLLPNMETSLKVENHGIVDNPERLASLYKRATVFVDTSDFQGFGRCALEAMACGTACVLTAGGGVSEYARDGYNAVVVPTLEAPDLASSVLELLEHPAKRKHLIRGGLETAATFDLRNEAHLTCDLFASFVEQDRHRAP